ncbi:MAG: hypothetical protein K0S32_659 [Bacteroidetes bacterium]|jgi:hypothetical protein|nr:hypothetical protein [Bacteroidota bacterium]
MSEIHDKQKETILALLAEKSVMKQDVFSNTLSVFNLLKDVLKERTDDLAVESVKIDKRITVNYKDVNPQSVQIKVAGDMLDFYMHSNVFEFDRSHPMFKTGYIKNTELNSYCGIINVYNFLADSYKYNRLNDLGYLIARIFVNREKRFFIETKTQIGYKYMNFSEQPIDKETLIEIVNELIIFAVKFDLFTPPYDAVRQVSVSEMQEKQNSNSLRTGKRLGYSGHTGSVTNDEEINL